MPGGAIVTNKRSGETRILTQKDVGGTKPQPLLPRDQLVPGTVYETARGAAKWDGARFIPQ
jgi:hypothetical protein